MSDIVRLLKGFSDEAEIEGGEDAQHRARDDLRRQRATRHAMNSGKPELAGAEFEAAHISRMLLHVPSGRYYVISQGLHETDYETFDAFLIDRSGDVVFLEEPASGPKTRAELDELRAGTR